jgi:hypothetical protein
VHQAVAIREVEKVAEGHQALAAAAVHHLAVADRAKVDRVVGPFVSQMRVVVHQLLKVLVVNKLKAVKRFVNY